jgi:mannitol-1-/sugar-/sorbitol-6-phosphatase
MAGVPWRQFVSPHRIWMPRPRSRPLFLRRIEGAAELLKMLPPRSWAVATSGPKAGAVERLRRAGLPVPAVLVGAEDVVRGKPSPDVYLEAARRLGMAPADCVVVEDAPAGIEAGRAAGMRVIALTTTHAIEELSADACAESLGSIQVRRLGVDRLELSYRLTA